MIGGNGHKGRINGTLIEFLDDEGVRETPDIFAQAGYRGRGWYYWAQDWTKCHGPFDSELQCETACAIGQRITHEDH